MAAAMCGGTPVFASEIEPYPIAVTRSRFPNMKHLGSVTDINGGEVEPVDIISFGSPCQDLSVAGKRAGLKHEDNGDDETTRSGLFMEAIRIIKEMRRATNGAYPRFAIWENVPGAFSSNKGEDFRTVLEELIKIVEPSAVMPAVPKNGWPYADYYCGDGWSLAYRVSDAQYWGVPQRRRRIYLVLDLRAECAGKILFEREGLRGYFAEGRTPWQGAAADAENGTGANDREGESTGGVAYGWPLGFRPENVRVYEETATTICNGTRPGFTCGVIEQLVLDDQGGQQINVRTDGKSPTLRAEMHGNIPAVMEPIGFDMYNQQPTGNISRTLKTPVGGDDLPVVFDPICCIDGDKIGKAERSGGSGLGIRDGDKMYTLTSKDAGAHAVAYGINGDVAATLDASYYKGCGMRQGVEREVVAYCVGNGQLNQITMAEQANTLDCMHDQQAVVYREAVSVRYIVRRLTPTECARLQGFADRWAVPDRKDDFTDEEYRFWLYVRNTHAAINGKAVKDYTKVQILKWYNGLYTDSSSYKLWGNGIALPNALYVMQGIADVINQ